MKCSGGYIYSETHQSMWRADAVRDGLDERVIVHMTGAVVEIDGQLLRLPDFIERVRRGAGVLDEKMPGWWAGIDTALLDLQSETACILGQAWVKLYSDVTGGDGFVVLAEKLFGVTGVNEGAGRDLLAEHGFTMSQLDGRLLNYQVDFGDSTAIWNQAWESLTQTWLAEIRTRQEAQADTEAGRRLYDEAVAKGLTHAQALATVPAQSTRDQEKVQ